MKRKITAVLLTLTLLATPIHSISAAVSAGKSFKVKYTTNNKYYTKKALVMRYGNSAISTPMPGFIYKSNAMFTGYYLCKNCKKLGVSYAYNKSKKRITLKRGSKTLVMTANKRSATLNGKKITLGVAPLKVYYKAKKKYYIMIPGQIVSSKLGLTYTWNQRLLSGVFGVPSSSSSNSSSSSTANATPDQPNTKITADATNYSARLKLPSGLSASSITTTDDYNNKRLILKISGNYKTHFASTSNRTIRDTLTYSTTYSDGYTYVYLKTSSIKGFSVTTDSSYIYVKYAAPTSMFNQVLVIDAGHGGTDSGAVGNGVQEKNLTLSIVKQIKVYFDANPNYKVYYTRLSDTYPSLAARYTLANNVGAHRFLSVHINSGTASSVGTETLYNPNGGKTGSLTGKELATIVQKDLQGATQFRNRGLQARIPGTNGVAVLTYSKMSASLGEVGFITNKSEVSYMTNNISKIAKSFYDGILNSY